MSGPASTRSDEDLVPSEELEEYRILSALGRGAMGRVYLAIDQLLERLVAIKVIAAPSPSDAARARFYTEAKAIARLAHPNVVTVYRIGELRRRPFLVSEYVRGQSLEQMAKPVPWPRALEIGVGLARGLAAAHRSGVLHRDIKPANAMIADDGAVKLLDFGLAELAPVAAPPGEVVPVSAPLPSPRVPAAEGEGGAAGGAITPPRSARHATDGEADAVSATVTLPSDASPSPTPRPQEAFLSTVQAGEAPSAPSIVGTPLYMAPEIWRSQPASPRSDVYSLGLVLYELCAGRAPHAQLDILKLSRAAQDGAPPVLEAAPGIEARLAAVIDRCLRPDPRERFADAESLREALEEISATPAPGASPPGDPYRGLLPFEAEHRAIFLGRAAETRAVLERLRAGRFVLVAGDSGAGKSSLCRAGVLPAVAEGALGAGDERPPPRVLSAVLGRRPLAALAAALAPLTGEDEAKLVSALRDEPWEVGRSLRRRGGPAPLLFVDQLEELCTLAEPAEARAAARALHDLADPAGGLRLLATARADFLARLAALPGLGDAITGSLYILLPLPPERLREVIVGPARQAGFSFASEAMVDALVADAAAGAGAGLPLLQFALAELWEARDEARREIPEAALAKLGGVRGALTRHADGVMARLPPPDRRQAQAILLRLVTAEGTRARRSEAELLGPGGAGAGALEALVRGRLVVAREGEDGSAYELAHEALQSGWETLQGWLGHDAEQRATLQRLSRAAAEWEQLGRAPDALWSGRRLAEAAELEEARLDAAAAAFLAASRRAARRAKIGRAAVIFGVPIVIGAAAVLSWLGGAHKLAQLADDRVRKGEKALAEGRLARDEGWKLHREAVERYDRQDNAGGNELWRGVLKGWGKAHEDYALAERELGLALLLGGDEDPARARMADSLAEHAELATWERKQSLREELLDKLAFYDDRDARRRRLTAPARLTVEAAPPGASVELRRFESHEGRRQPSPPLPLEQEHEPGSYLLTFKAEGRAPVRLPLVLEPGKDQRITVALPRADTVPDGFAYVPEGWFLFGNNDFGEAEIDGRGHQYDPQPLHPVRTDAYLIGLNEVTFGEWLTFLRALPPEEREKRTPAIEGKQGSVALTEEGERYRLTLKIEDGKALTALEGEPLEYPDRQERRTQQWLRMPVSGVSYEDARAYAQWLAESGRVPGARLCSEHEWERAARGADDRRFPGGDRLGSDANYDLTYGRKPLAFGPDEVGSHPGSDSPFGVHDLAGNVWEWATPLTPEGQPALRGGSFYQTALASLSMNRADGTPGLRVAVVGIRLCASPNPR